MQIQLSDLNGALDPPKTRYILRRRLVRFLEHLQIVLGLSDELPVFPVHSTDAAALFDHIQSVHRTSPFTELRGHIGIPPRSPRYATSREVFCRGSHALSPSLSPILSNFVLIVAGYFVATLLLHRDC